MRLLRHRPATFLISLAVPPKTYHSMTMHQVMKVQMSLVVMVVLVVLMHLVEEEELTIRLVEVGVVVMRLLRHHPATFLIALAVRLKTYHSMTMHLVMKVQMSLVVVVVVVMMMLLVEEEEPRICLVEEEQALASLFLDFFCCFWTFCFSYLFLSFHF